MDNCRNKIYDKHKNLISKGDLKVVTIPQIKPERKVGRIKATINVPNKKKKRSALEISDSIGIYGAFDRTLADLHKQGR